MIRLKASALALALLAGGVLAPATSQAQVFVGVQVRFAPPVLPVYAQPPVPGPDYLWTPGYWAWDEDYGDYYWVPGTWVTAPRPGYLWTPSYWGWSDGLYVFHGGYWGPHIGYYGGVNYGFGYTGSGFEGGYWNGGHYFYNSSVNNVRNANITNVYNKTVIVNRTTINNVSYSGGPGGVHAAPTPEQMAASRENHISATPMQTQHIAAAQSNRALFASANHGAPPVAATAAAGRFSGPGIVRAAHASPAASPAAGPGYRSGPSGAGGGYAGAYAGGRGEPQNPSFRSQDAARPEGDLSRSRGAYRDAPTEGGRDTYERPGAPAAQKAFEAPQPQRAPSHPPAAAARAATPPPAPAHPQASHPPHEDHPHR